MAIYGEARLVVTPDPAQRQTNVSNLFHTAIEDNDVTQAKILLKYANVKLETRNILGQTALHRCCDKGSVELVRLLLEHGAELETRDPRGWTAMHYAASNDHYDVVRFLLAHCASMDVKSCDGSLPLDYATHERVRRLLYTTKIAKGAASPDRTSSSSSSGVGTEEDEEVSPADEKDFGYKSATLPRNLHSRRPQPSRIPRAIPRDGKQAKDTSTNPTTDGTNDLDGLNLTLRRRPKKCSLDSSYGRYLTTGDRRTVYDSRSLNGEIDGEPSVNDRSASCEVPATEPQSPVGGLKRSQSTKIPLSSGESAPKEPKQSSLTSWMRNSFGKKSTSSRVAKKTSLPVTKQEQRDHVVFEDDRTAGRLKGSLSLRKRLRMLSIRRATSEACLGTEDTYLSPKIRRTGLGSALNTTT